MTERQRDELRRKLREHAEKKRQQMVLPDPAPRYDEVYFAGAEWLDRVARGDEQD